MKFGSLIVFVFAALSGTVSFANLNLVAVVNQSQAYIQYVAQNPKQSLTCKSVDEVKTTAGYGKFVDRKVSFQLVVLDCKIDLHDNMGDVYAKGLAILTDKNEVVSFVTSYIPQPD